MFTPCSKKTRCGALWVSLLLVFQSTDVLGVVHGQSESGANLSLLTLQSQFTGPIPGLVSLPEPLPNLPDQTCLSPVREPCSFPTQLRTIHRGSRQCLQQLLLKPWTLDSGRKMERASRDLGSPIRPPRASGKSAPVLALQGGPSGTPVLLERRGDLPKIIQSVISLHTQPFRQDLAAFSQAWLWC